MTISPSTLTNLQARLVANLHTINLGIVGDAAHIRDGGYHIGAASLRANGMSGDYSLQYAIDKAATHDYACAIDIGGSDTTLMTIGNRLVHALKNHDPRVYGKVRAVNAPFDGVSIDRRLDDESPTTSTDDNVQASSDRGHIHAEFYRTLVTKQSVMDGFYNVCAGIPLGDSMSAAEVDKIIKHIDASQANQSKEIARVQGLIIHGREVSDSPAHPVIYGLDQLAEDVAKIKAVLNIP